MVDILNLALPYFGLIFICFACGKAKGMPESGLSWMNFFLLYVSLPALLFGIMSKTPFAELNNPPFLVATTLGTVTAFFLAMLVGKLIGRLSLREATLAGLSGAYGNIGYMGPGLALALLGSKAAAPTALIFCCDSIFLFSIVPLLIELTDRDHPSLLHALGVVARQIVLNPLIMSAVLGALVAALHIELPVALDRMIQFLQHAAAPTALFVLGVTVGAAPVQAGAVGSARRDRDQASDPSAGGVRIDAAVRPVRATLGGDRSADGRAAAGAERLRDRAPERHLDRTGLGRGADRNIRVRGHTDQRDVADSKRSATVSLKLRRSIPPAATTAQALRASQDAAGGRSNRSGAGRRRAVTGWGGNRSAGSGWRYRSQRSGS